MSNLLLTSSGLDNDIIANKPLMMVDKSVYDIKDIYTDSIYL